MESPKILFVGDNFPTLKELLEKLAAGAVLLKAQRGSGKSHFEQKAIEELIELARHPGKTERALEAFQKIVWASTTVALSEKEAENILKIMADDKIKVKPYYKPKPKAWTPGQTAPMRRGRK